MKRLGLLLLLALPAAATDYVNQTLLLGDVGAQTVSVTGSGSIATNTYTVFIPLASNQRFLFHASPGGYPESGYVTALTTTNSGSVNSCTFSKATWAGGGVAVAGGFPAVGDVCLVPEWWGEYYAAAGGGGARGADARVV